MALKGAYQRWNRVCTFHTICAGLSLQWDGSLIDESIAHTDLSQQVLWHGRVGFDLFAQVGHVHAHVVGVFTMSRAPDGLEQMAMRDDAIWLTGQVSEQLVLNGGEVDECSLFAQLALDEVQLQFTKANGAVATGRLMQVSA